MTLTQQRRKHTFHSHLLVLHQLSLLPDVLFRQINCCWGGERNKTSCNGRVNVHQASSHLSSMVFGFFFQRSPSCYFCYYRSPAPRRTSGCWSRSKDSGAGRVTVLISDRSSEVENSSGGGWGLPGSGRGSRQASAPETWAPSEGRCSRI